MIALGHTLFWLNVVAAIGNILMMHPINWIVAVFNCFSAFLVHEGLKNRAS